MRDSITKKRSPHQPFIGQRSVFVYQAHRSNCCANNPVMRCGATAQKLQNKRNRNRNMFSRSLPPTVKSVVPS